MTNWKERCKGCGECCGSVPIFKHIWEKHKDKAIDLKKVVDMDNKVLPVRKDSPSCVFLTEEKLCAIYEDRPETCRKYGNETDIMLKCPYYDKDGNKRSVEEREEVQEEIDEGVNKKMDKVRKYLRGKMK